MRGGRGACRLQVLLDPVGDLVERLLEAVVHVDQPVNGIADWDKAEAHTVVILGVIPRLESPLQNLGDGLDGALFTEE